MLLGGLLEAAFSGNRAGYFNHWYLAFLLEAMGDYDGPSLMKEVEHSVVHSLETGPKLVDAVAEVIRLGSSKLMSQHFQPFETRQTFPSRLIGQTIQPFQKRNPPAFVLKKENRRQLGSRLCSQTCEQTVKPFLLCHGSGIAPVAW